MTRCNCPAAGVPTYTCARCGAPGATRYYVDIVNRPRQWHGTLGGALDYAQRMVYTGPETLKAAQTAVEAGREYSYAYGFTEVSIGKVQQ